MPHNYRVWTHSRFPAESIVSLTSLAELITGERPPTAAWFQLASSCHALIIGGTTLMDAATMDRLGPKVAVIARPGIGVDMIDTQAATQRGIMVVNTPNGPTESTAEHAIALILNLAKGIAIADRVLRSGAGFPNYGTLLPGLELRGASLGLIGLGRIGSRVAEIAQVLGMRVLAFDPFLSPERASQHDIHLVATLEELLPQVDIVSVHCPATPQTRHLINASTLALMKAGSYFINVARGAIVDETALISALQSGHLAGAGLDVFDPEPTIPDHPLYSLPNTITTPHIASYTAACVLRMQTQACEQVAMALAGEHPHWLVNPEVWGQTRHKA